jgi:segregation and condensation protein B
MSVKEDLATLEAALYAADRPLSLAELRRILGTSSETYTQKLMGSLMGEYKRRKGSLILAETAKDTFALRLRDEYMPKLEGVLPKTKLSKGAMKTLALIAYKQPIYQAKLAELRRGRVYDHVKLLTTLGFVESKPFGRTRVLRTSKKFAGYFGFEDDMDKIRDRLQEFVR